MKRYAVVAMFALVAAATLSAQSPKGWMVRADRSTTASDPDGAGSIKFTQTGNSFHAVNPQAAVYWTPANTASGAYTVKGTFTLLKPSGHTNYYGIVFGGSDLDKATQAQLNRGARLVEILKQPQYEPLPVERQVALIYAGTNGYLDSVAVADLQAFEAGLYAFIDTRHSDVFRGIVEKKVLDDTLKKGLDAAVKEFTAEFSASKATAA